MPAPLTDCLSVILKTAHHPAFPFSKDLMLQKSCLSKNDIKCLHKALCDGKLQDLREINLSDNMLTDCLIKILGKAHHPKFTALETMNLANCQLGPADVKCLFTALLSGKFPILKQLSFLPATMTNCLAHILICERRRLPTPGSMISIERARGYPFSEELPLQNTSLTKDDIKSLF